jgi:hypothetical protein
MAIRLLASHCANGHLSPEEEHIFRNIVLWNLRKETDKIILAETVASLETAPCRETKREAASIVRNRDPRFSAPELRKLRKHSEGVFAENKMMGGGAKILKLTPPVQNAQAGALLNLAAGGGKA